MQEKINPNEYLPFIDFEGFDLLSKMAENQRIHDVQKMDLDEHFW